MKGFPNQVAELPKITTAIHTLVNLVDSGKNPRDDGVFGVALVRAGVAGTGHTARPVEDYIREQLKKKESNQSFRTTARGLRELFRLLGLIDDSDGLVLVTDLGRQAASYAGTPMEGAQIDFWRRTIRNLSHPGAHGHVSHPYQVLLRLVARKPCITRAKCALALEARDDSAGELDRIAGLVDLDEDGIRHRIGVTESNWDNAKKVLPRFAEQLQDVIKDGQSYTIAIAPGRAEEGARIAREPENNKRPKAPRAPRSSRSVTPDTIGVAGTAEGFDEVSIPPNIDPAAAQEAVRQRLGRLRRHNLVVRSLAVRLEAAGARLFEDPFDILALFDRDSVLVEVKSLDRTAPDERSRVQEALAQLLYYEAFVTEPIAGEAVVQKIACFEASITEAHQGWLNAANIGTIWQIGEGRFAGDALATRVLGNFIEELRD